LSNNFSGVTSQGPASCYLLPSLAVAGPTEPSRAKATRLLWISVHS